MKRIFIIQPRHCLFFSSNQCRSQQSEFFCDFHLCTLWNPAQKLLKYFRKSVSSKMKIETIECFISSDPHYNSATIVISYDIDTSATPPTVSKSSYYWNMKIYYKMCVLFHFISLKLKELRQYCCFLVSRFDKRWAIIHFRRTRLVDYTDLFDQFNSQLIISYPFSGDELDHFQHIFNWDFIEQLVLSKVNLPTFYFSVVFRCKCKF